jgi:hypothetical protein
MSTSYLTLTQRGPDVCYVITDTDGLLLLEVRGQYRSKIELMVVGAADKEVAVISGGAFSRRLTIRAGDQVISVRPAGGIAQRFAIDCPAGFLAGASAFTGSRFSLTRDGVQVAAMTREKTRRAHYRIEIADNQDRILIHLLLLAMYIIRGGGSPGD